MFNATQQLVGKNSGLLFQSSFQSKEKIYSNRLDNLMKTVQSSRPKNTFIPFRNGRRIF